MRTQYSAYALAAVAALTLAACKPAPAPEAPTPAETQTTADTSTQPAMSTDTPTPVAAAPAPSATIALEAFVGKVWQVKDSSAVEAGTTYAFLADGTLVVDSDSGTPLYGQWKFDAGKLTLIEEGQSYPTDILKLDAGEFRIRSHNPGEPVETLLVPAADQTLPKAKP
ncbi:hypothetical protein ASD53_13070 [Lysobacter sp. Root559]|uniref:hypothetical protein n=1 Tax=Lysobacter sp. Root559 TaxID=1736559 RepID=UPI0006FA5BBA|nr:hypothetical protein [Lysobacter sp. Root559]KQZ56470.1 hypothetical protein ASD53_13070 [Lysobacter sp. Root559]